MFVRDIGEFGLIERLRAVIERKDARVLVGIGDDAAVVRYDRPVVMTTDALVEGVHFREDLIDPVSTGFKALVASLSDVAAMGGKPMHALVTLAVPKTAVVEPLVDIYRGLASACESYDVSIVGGDVVSTDGPLVVSVTVTGELLGERPLLRSGARAGDFVFVTGDLGGAAAYIHMVENPAGARLAPEDEWVLQVRHRRPTPQLDAGRALAAMPYCTSTNDISDGLSSELHEIAEASSVRIVIEADRIPTLPAARHYARLARMDALQFALFGGEDYQIVGTIASVGAGVFLSSMEALGIRVTWIGKVETGPPSVLLSSSEGRVDLPKKGFDHFRRNVGQDT